MHLARCQILRSNTIFMQFNKKVFFNIVKDLFTSIEIQRRSGKIQISSKGEGIFCSGCSGERELSTLSDFALKILSI